MTKFIPVSRPSIGEKEIAYVSDAIASGWVSSLGPYIESFERGFAEFVGTNYALTASNGTTGLHLALVAAGIKAGDEVVVPDLTFIATANAVVHAGAKPVFADIDAETLCIDPQAAARVITPRTRAIIPVHLYGHPADMDAINAIADAHGLLVIEDAAEAHGATYKGQRVGGLGKCGVFSFYGNKVITSGEGGMITTNDEALYQTAKRLRDHAMSPTRRYWHEEIGYNYRITNLQAALGLAQLERIEDFIQRRREIMDWYRAGLTGVRAAAPQPAGSVGRQRLLDVLPRGRRHDRCFPAAFHAEIARTRRRHAALFQSCFQHAGLSRRGYAGGAPPVAVWHQFAFFCRPDPRGRCVHLPAGCRDT